MAQARRRDDFKTWGKKLNFSLSAAYLGSMRLDTKLEARYRSLKQPMSVAEVAARLSLSESFVRKKIHEGKLIARGGSKIEGSDLADYMKAHRI